MTCPECDGEGSVVGGERDDGSEWLVTCDRCDGTGELEDDGRREDPWH